MSIQGDAFRSDQGIDDVMIFGRSFDNAIDNSEQVFGSFHAVGLKLNPSKCKLYRRSLTFLCYIVSSEGAICYTRNIEAIRD